jgi:DNA invertase Pin-like site-specific DNA recombinase
MSERSLFRCAVYTRKSTEEGLEQDFNSLDAQREACEAFIASQAGLGWKLIRNRYDDGGLSSGTMDRPALRRLLDDITMGKVDVVVVYKIDRLTRSLMDFAKIVEVFDGKAVSFVSVTQQFNTTTSMGRLTLNVLLSFAQFEREVTAERIRDKIAASKRKGMWMGGPPPLGYDIANKRLVVNEAEAKTVRRLFDLYCEVRSVRQLKILADKAGIRTKHRTLADGRLQGGKSFSPGNLYALLSNPVYVGRIRYKGETFEGLHEAIIDRSKWDQVHAILSGNAVVRRSPENASSPCVLTGLVYDETGDRLSPSHAVKDGVRYHYYVSHRLMGLRGQDRGGWRLPAKELEQPILAALADRFSNGSDLPALLDTAELSAEACRTILDGSHRLAERLQSGGADCRNLLHSMVRRIDLHPDRIVIGIDPDGLISILPPAKARKPEAGDTTVAVTIDIPVRLKRRGVETKLVIGTGLNPPSKPDRKLVELIAKAHRWLAALTDGTTIGIAELANQEAEDPNEVSRFLPLAFLAPDIVESIVKGTQPVDLTVERLRRIGPLSLLWDQQRQVLGFAG